MKLRELLAGVCEPPSETPHPYDLWMREATEMILTLQDKVRDLETRIAELDGCCDDGDLY